MSLKNEQCTYKHDHSVGLVTTASEINLNLALLHTEDYFQADTLIVAHEGYLNYIPLLNKNVRRAKYVPICFGSDRGKGQIKWIKWMKFENETYFVCLSSIGVQIYDVELTDIQYEYNFEDLSSKLGVTMGIIILFKMCNDIVKKINHFRISSFYALDGYENYLVTISSKEITCYQIEKGRPNVYKQLKEEILSSVFKVIENLLFIGFTNGYLSLISLPNLMKIERTKVHDEEITALDYSKEKQFILSCSQDLYLKVWSFNRNKSLECIFKFKSHDLPFCGCGFSIQNGNEFCVIKSQSLHADFFIYSKEHSEEKLDELECEWSS